jgi:ABC-2 type transport system permease protein
MNTLDILRFEIKHFRRSKFKVIGFGFFLLACGYGLAEGFRVYAQHQAGIATVQTQAQEVRDKVIGWFDAGKTGPEDRPWVDVTTPFWAIYNSPTPVAKEPSALLPLSIGQAEQYGYYKQVTNWSSTYDSDIIEEIANPERLAAGGIDFSFAVLFLAPILLILLTYDLGGLERDLSFLNLIAVQTGQVKKWLLFRLSFYVLLVFVAILAMTLATAASTQAFTQAPADLMQFLLGTGLYLVFWGLLIFAIIRVPKASNMQAFQMVAIWLTLCVILPGTIHQVASLRYPASYMTDFIDASREKADAIAVS